jgi:hypothetical protein
MNLQRSGSIVLLLEEWAKQDEISAASVAKAAVYIPLVLDLFKRVVDRKTGAMLKLIKFHMPVHFCDNIKRYGVPNNYDTNAMEKNHKKNARQPGKKTQRNTHKFDMQTAIRLDIVSKRAFDDLEIFWTGKPPRVMAATDDTAQAGGDDGMRHWTVSGSKFVVTATDFLLYDPSCHDKFRAVPSIGMTSQEQQLRWITHIRRRVLSRVEANVVEPTILLRTELRSETDNVIVRCHPSSRKDRTEWYDWVNIQWGAGEGGIIPCHVRMVLEIPVLQETDGCLRRHDADFDDESGPGIFLLIETIEIAPNADIGGSLYNHSRVNQDGRTVLWAEKEVTEHGNTRLYIVPIGSIDSPCIAIPDPQTAQEVRLGNTDHYLFVLPRNRWAEVFERQMSEENKGRGAARGSR